MKLHIILDLNGTLVSDHSPITYRPGAKEFVTWCFDNFETVSIWSKAGEYFVNKISKELLPEGKQWLFVKYGSKKLKYKRLSNIWKDPDFKEYNLNFRNTLIIDNTQLCCKKNQQNSIIINSYLDDANDIELYLLSKYLSALLSTDFIYKDIRTLEHSQWRIFAGWSMYIEINGYVKWEEYINNKQ